MDQETLRQRLKTSVDLSNEILSDREKSVVRELLYEAWNVVSSIDIEILALEARRAKELEWITRLRVGISPQKQAPPEILGHIFKFCVDDESYVVNIPLQHRPQGLVLSQICSRWRQAALAEPSLWNVVSIYDPPRVCLEALEAILSRAGHVITFHLTMVDIPPPVLQIIHEYSDRFQNVLLRFPIRLDVQFFDVPFSRLGALRKLELYVEDLKIDPDPFPLYRAISAFKNSSNNPQVEFGLIASRVSLDLQTSASLFFPWLHLEHLEIECTMTLSEFLGILAEWQCMQLVSCEVLICPNNGDGLVIPGNTTSLPNLTSLTLKGYGDDIDEVLDSIATPSLQVLAIEYGLITPYALLSLIQQSQCNFQSIDVALSPAPMSGIKQLLLAIPGVIRLTLVGSNVISEDILDSIKTWDLVPHVEVLELRVSSCRAVQELVSNRCNPSLGGSKKALRSFIAWVPPEDVTGEWQQFQLAQLHSEAVRIEFGIPGI